MCLKDSAKIFSRGKFLRMLNLYGFIALNKIKINDLKMKSDVFYRKKIYMRALTKN